MGYTAPITQVAGTTILSADWNTYVRDNILFLANPPACRVFHNTTQNLSNGADVVMLCNSERYDTDGMHSTSVDTGRVTMTTAGLYTVGAYVALQTDTDYTLYRLLLRLNGATNIAGQTATHTYAGGIGAQMTVETTYKFAAADYFEAVAVQVNTSAGTLTCQPELWATWVGTG